MAHAEFRVVVEWERTQGKFAPRDEITGAIQEALDEANPSSIDSIGADGDSDYEITEWSVDEVTPAKRR